MNSFASFFQALSQLPLIETVMVLLPLIGTFIAGIALTFMSKQLYLRCAFALLSLAIVVAAPFSANFQLNTLVQTQQTQQDAMKYQQSLAKHFNLHAGDAKPGEPSVNFNFRLMKQFERLDTKEKELVELLAELLVDTNKHLVARMEEQTRVIDDLIADSEGYLSDKVSSASVDVIGQVSPQQVIPREVIADVNRGITNTISEKTVELSLALTQLSDNIKIDLTREMAQQQLNYQQTLALTTEQYLALSSAKHNAFLLEISAVLTDANQQFSRDLALVSDEIKQIKQVLAGKQNAEFISLHGDNAGGIIVAERRYNHGQE